MQQSSPERYEEQSVRDILLGCPRDSAGMYEVGGFRYEQLSNWLNTLGMLGNEPSQEDIAEGIARATKLQNERQLVSVLSSMEFVSEYAVSKHIRNADSSYNIWLEKPMYAEPEKILGAESFTNWLGRGHNGQGQVAIREHRGHRTSLEQIIDYATRDSPLPYLSADGGLNLFIGDEGTFFFSSNSHRAAAAKLRHEPLGFRSLRVYQ